MSQLKDLYEKAKNSKNNLLFSDLCSLVEKTGFIFKRQKGTSHRIYKHPEIRDPLDCYGLLNIQDDRGKAKPRQIETVLDLIEKYDLLEGRG